MLDLPNILFLASSVTSMFCDEKICESGYNGEHATSVNGIGNPTEEDMIAVGTEIRISRKRCLEIIAGMREVVKKYSLM